MRINNLNGTGDKKCGCGSWLDHWKKFSRQYVSDSCSAKFCYNSPEVGAHVQKDGDYDKSWYIVPLCQKCNLKTYGSLDIRDSVVLVSANVNETCG